MLSSGEDGSIQGITAALKEPDYCEPETYGELLHKRRDFNEEILIYTKEDLELLFTEMAIEPLSLF
ncbi:hypothetical protein [Halobacillus amylolyticus]|uniref:Uncharacterized protein n=1 Tax=Halobacillus amylolyticus TaxID=2932259 RepID=A0ABY4HA77_9BACI|nr:hypothetical protein [Halobacillus amylolyticus]UOR11338.1 hypothetical protein MUO15_17330 [Halobacillus amylolyticus]